MNSDDPYFRGRAPARSICGFGRATSGDRKTTEIDEYEIVKIVLPDSDPDPNSYLASGFKVVLNKSFTIMPACR